jgi:hypothetical protein
VIISLLFKCSIHVLVSEQKFCWDGTIKNNVVRHVCPKRRHLFFSLDVWHRFCDESLTQKTYTLKLKTVVKYCISLHYMYIREGRNVWKTCPRSFYKTEKEVREASGLELIIPYETKLGPWNHHSEDCGNAKQSEPNWYHGQEKMSWSSYQIEGMWILPTFFKSNDDGLTLLHSIKAHFNAWNMQTLSIIRHKNLLV